MSNVTSTLDIRLIDDVSPAAKKVAEALKAAERQAKEMEAALSKSGLSDKMQSDLKRIGATKGQIEGAAAAWRDYAKAQNLGADRTQWTREQINSAKNMASVHIASMKAVQAQDRAIEAQRLKELVKAEEQREREAHRRIEDAKRIAEQEAKEQRRVAEQLAAEKRRLAEQEQRDRQRISEQDARDERQRAERRARDLKHHADQEHREAQRLHEIREHGISKSGLGHFVLGGLAAGASAHGVMRGVEYGLDAGVERQHILAGMRLAGMKADEIARAHALATKVSKDAPNMSMTELMELHKEARSGVQHPEEAFELMPDLARAASILKGSGVENANIADIVKGGESLGLMSDPKRFHKYLEGQIKAMQVMGKTITSEQVYEAAKYTKSAGGTLSDDFINTTLPSLIQEMHGSSAGDALSSLTKRWRGGLAHQHLAVTRLNDMGLLEDPSKIVRAKKSGEIMGYTGKLKGDELLGSDPDKFFQDVWKPAAEAMGAKTLGDKIKLLNETLPSTAANLGRIVLQQEETLRQHRANYEAAPGLEQSVDIQKNDPKVAMQSLLASLNDLTAAASGDLMAGAAKGLSALADALKSLAETAKDHPVLAAGAGLLGAGGALAGSGYLSYQLMNGFGLGTSASALTGAAGALTESAVALGAKGLPGGPLGKTGASLLAGASLPLFSAGIILGGGAVAGGTNSPMVDDFGRVTGNWGGKDETGNPSYVLPQSPSSLLPSGGDPWLNGGREAIERQSALAADAFRRDPEASRGQAIMGHFGDLDAVKAKADEAHAALSTLDMSVTPQVSLASLDALIAKAAEARQALASIGGRSGGGGVSSGRSFHPAPAGRMLT